MLTGDVMLVEKHNIKNIEICLRNGKLYFVKFVHCLLVLFDSYCPFNSNVLKYII